MLIFSKTGRDYQPPAPILCEIFLGMAWGVQNMGMGEGKGRICRGNPCFSGFFSYNAHDSDAPEGGENERIGGGFAWGCAQKKSPGMVNS